VKKTEENYFFNHFPYNGIYKKLSCRRETAGRFVSLNILLSHLSSLKIILNDVVEYGVSLY